MSAPLLGKVTSPNGGMIHTTLQYIYLLIYWFLCNAQYDIFSLDYSLLGSTIIYVAFKIGGFGWFILGAPMKQIWVQQRFPICFIVSCIWPASIAFLIRHILDKWVWIVAIQWVSMILPYFVSPQPTYWCNRLLGQKPKKIWSVQGSSNLKSNMIHAKSVLRDWRRK